MKPKYNLQSENNIPTVKDRIKQKTQEEAQRIGRFEMMKKKFFFKNDAKKIYRETGKQPIEIKACVRYFLIRFLFFLSNVSPSKTVKNVFHFI